MAGDDSAYLTWTDLPNAVTVHGDCPDFRSEARENGTVPLGP